jgi:pyridinium-3,5-biscarboxylic acid mononucleotide synthase
VSDRTADLHAALNAYSALTTAEAPSGVAAVGDFARLDLDRRARTGRPEVVYAAGKTADQLVAIVGRIAGERGQALASRVSEAQFAALTETFAAPEWAIERREGYPTVVVRRAGFAPAPTGGHVGILTAGTSDLLAADEARAMAEAMGCRTTLVADVGVAGIHRLFGPLDALLSDGVGAIIVAAGMDGALPSVVAGLAPVPTIGLPTSVGYGAGGGGVAALLSMLQTCVPGLTVVNIDNGIGAGATAAMIARGVVSSQ